MSIPRDVLLAQVRALRLAPLMPLSRRAQILRALFVTEGIRARLDGDFEDEIEAARYGALRADLENFVTEGVLYPNYLFWLTPKNAWVWEIRSVADAPSLRVLGRFADRDVFVALTLEERAELKGWNSKEWKRAIRTAAQRWATVFNPYQPHQGRAASDFFSGAVPKRYFKK